MQEAAAWVGLGKQKESTARPLGTPTASWTYHHPNGDPYYEVRRYDLDNGKKEFRPYNLTTRKWEFPTPRIVYDAHKLADPELADAAVHFFEGEKCCEAAKSKGLHSCTTTSGGAGSPQCSDFSPVSGRTVYIFPDNDPAGQQYAEAVAKLCLTVHARPFIVPIPEGKTEKWDIADAVAEGWTLDEIEHLREQAKPYAPSLLNGDAHTSEMGDEEDEDEETDEEENARMMREERPSEDPWPCPALLFRGPFRRVAEEMGKFTWEVWTSNARGARSQSPPQHCL